MQSFVLGLEAAELIHLLRAEAEATHGAPELSIAAELEYIIEEDFDRAAYGLGDGAEYDLVTSMATLSVEPRVEGGYWILDAIIERALGLLQSSQEDQLTRRDLTLDAFATELSAPGRKRVAVRLFVQTPAIRQDFNRWLAEMRAKHPWKPSSAGAQPLPTEHAVGGSGIYRTKEVVGVFRDAKTLESAVSELEASGFDRSAISVLATDAHTKTHLDRLYGSVWQVDGNRRLAQDALSSRGALTDAGAAAIGIPIYIGGFAGIAAVAATGGALALAIAAMIAGAAAGAGVSAILSAALVHRHVEEVRELLDRGALVLWVAVVDATAEKRALLVFEKMGAQHVHIHEINRKWRLSDVPV